MIHLPSYLLLIQVTKRLNLPIVWWSFGDLCDKLNVNRRVILVFGQNMFVMWYAGRVFLDTKHTVALENPSVYLVHNSHKSLSARCKEGEGGGREKRKRKERESATFSPQSSLPFPHPSLPLSTPATPNNNKFNPKKPHYTTSG